LRHTHTHTHTHIEERQETYSQVGDIETEQHSDTDRGNSESIKKKNQGSTACSITTHTFGVEYATFARLVSHREDRESFRFRLGFREEHVVAGGVVDEERRNERV
jgi:hypothetical protein